MISIDLSSRVNFTNTEHFGLVALGFGSRNNFPRLIAPKAISRNTPKGDSFVRNCHNTCVLSDYYVLVLYKLYILQTKSNKNLTKTTVGDILR